jgi:hypothetical protein
MTMKERLKTLAVTSQFTVKDIYVPSKHSVMMATIVIGGREIRNVGIPFPNHLPGEFSMVGFPGFFSDCFRLNIVKAVQEAIDNLKEDE